MKTRIVPPILSDWIFITLCCLVFSLRLNAQSTAFTYQGQLMTNGHPAQGRYDFQFTLFATESEGSPVTEPVKVSAIAVSNGLFTALLDFGPNVFTGQDRWLAIAVCPVGSGVFTKDQANRYTVTFDPPFTEAPTVTASVFFITTSGGFVMPADVSASQATFRVYDAGGNIRPGSFYFIAIGRR